MSCDVYILRIINQILPVIRKFCKTYIKSALVNSADYSHNLQSVVNSA